MLEGVRVVDLSRDPGAAYAARMFALLGADVVKVEPPEGDPARRRGPRRGDDGESSALFAYLNAAKRSAILDSAVDADRTTLLRLIGHADVVFEDGAPGWWKARGIDFAALTATYSQLVVVSVTPFGQDGPRAGWRATALTSLASSGQLALSGDPDAPPLKVVGQQAYYQGGLHAFSAALTALYAVRREGLGDWIDLSLQEVQAASLEAAGPVAMVRELDTGRAGNQARAVWGIYPCADGYVGVASMARQTGSVYRCIEHPELAEDPRFADLINNPEMNEVASMLIEEWTMARRAQEIFEASQRHRAPFSLIPTPRDLLEWAPLRASGFWSEVTHPTLGTHPLPGAPFTLNGERARATRPAPLLGQHTDEVMREAAEPPPAAPASGGHATRLPFDGLRVLDLSQVWAGPYAARFLADMGADVIHIEGPGFPDAVRGLMRSDDPRSFNKATYFNEYNRNKRGLALDLHRPEGMEAFKRLVPLADVVIENWSVGVSERLDIGYDELRALNPRIVFVQMPGFSKDLPESERVGFGPTIEQMGGLVALQGYQGGPPHKSGISYGDPIAGSWPPARPPSASGAAKAAARGATSSCRNAITSSGWSESSWSRKPSILITRCVTATATRTPRRTTSTVPATTTVAGKVTRSASRWRSSMTPGSRLRLTRTRRGARSAGLCGRHASTTRHTRRCPAGKPRRPPSMPWSVNGHGDGTRPRWRKRCRWRASQPVRC